MELNHTIAAAYETFQVPSPLFWVAIIICSVLAPASLNMTLECQFISCLRGHQHSDPLLLQFAKGDRRFPILSIPLWKVVWQKQHWSFRSWVGVFGVVHLTSLAAMLVFSAGAVNYRQRSYPYFAVIIATAIHTLSIAHQALVVYYSSRKIYNWLAPSRDPKAQTQILRANFSRDNWRVFCASFCIEFAFIFYAFYTDMIMVQVLRIFLISHSAIFLVSLPLELRRYHALYHALGQVHPHLKTDSSTLETNTQISVQKKKARKIAATNMRMLLILSMGMSVQLTVVASPVAVRDQRFSTVVLVCHHGSGIVLFCLQKLYHIVGTHSKVHKQRKLYRQRQEQTQTTPSMIPSIDPNASQLFG